ncbi:uncharacterized protein LOC121367411 isoform X2 [Gigantopelta aegis]|uniref:uncharacterized protein LOC121367411 isoform X2 n=1 Tax=Gigantopelta aegis TaxID=1735272 RepID=UPI001B888173|nr:uncharacterized protein LOC121367411 isoform X2 [Gigantopelta aegis]
MQSRQMRKLQYVRHAGHAADKWLHQRKVDLGVIFESWKSLRDKRADTDPGLAFHLMEIHDQYCFCRFEESESTVRDGDLVGSYDVSEYSKHSQETDEVIDRFSNSSTPDTPGFSQKQETSDVSNSVDPGNRSSDQQHESKVETLSRPRDTFDDSSSPPVNEAYVNEPTLPPREHSVLPDKLTSPQTSGYSPIISVSIGSPHAPTQPAYVFQSENMPEQSDSALATLYRPADSDLRVKAEPIAIDSEPDESDDVPRVSHIPGMTTSAGETPGHNLQRQQLTTDRKLCTASPSAMSEGFKHLIMEEIINSGGDVYSGLVPQGTFGRVGSHMNESPRVIEDLWYKFVYSRSLSASSQMRARSRMKKKISKPELEFIAGLRTGNPNITEMEIKRRLKQDLNVEVSQPTINRAIRQELMFVKWNHKRWQMHK